MAPSHLFESPLVGLTFTPEVFAAGVDLVGISNLVTWFNSNPPYWAPLKALFARRVGDPDKDEEFLQSRSPLFLVARIKAPLLIGQGANDVRVVQAESDQIVAAMRQAHIPVEYVVYTDEGHWQARPENRLHFLPRRTPSPPTRYADHWHMFPTAGEKDVTLCIGRERPSHSI